MNLGWRSLACRILEQAHVDAHNSNGHRAAREIGLPEGLTLASDAQAFLRSPGARWLVGLLDLESDTLDRVLEGLPPPAWEQLALRLGR